MCNIQRIFLFLKSIFISQNKTLSPLADTFLHAGTFLHFPCREAITIFLPCEDWRNSFSHHLDLPIEGAVAGGIVLGEGTLQGIHHSNILGGKGWLQPPASGPDNPAGHSPQSPGRLLWLSNGKSLRPHTKTQLWCWCCHDAIEAGRQRGASGSCRRDGTLASRETKQKSGREKQKSIVFGLFISNPTRCQGLPGRFVTETLLFSCHLFLRGNPHGN